MVEIKSQSQEEEIEEYWLSVSQDGEHHAFWLGLTDIFNEGIYDFLHLLTIDKHVLKAHLCGTELFNLSSTLTGLLMNQIMEKMKHSEGSIQSMNQFEKMVKTVWLLAFAPRECGVICLVIFILRLPFVNMY